MAAPKKKFLWIFTVNQKINVDVVGTMGVMLKHKTEFLIKRIPDIGTPTFFIMSGAVVLFEVSIRDTLKLYAVVDKIRSPLPFITSTHFQGHKITFKVDNKTLGTCVSKEQVEYAVLGSDGEENFGILTSGDRVHCKVVQGLAGKQLVATMDWDRFWTESDTHLINPSELPPSPCFTLKFEDEVELLDKALLLVSSFCVHYSQRPIRAKRCTRSVIIIICLCIALLILSALPLAHYVMSYLSTQ